MATRPAAALLLLLAAAALLLACTEAFQQAARTPMRMALFGSRPPPKKEVSAPPANKPRPFFVRPDKVAKESVVWSAGLMMV